MRRTAKWAMECIGQPEYVLTTVAKNKVRLYLFSITAGDLFGGGTLCWNRAHDI